MTDYSLTYRQRYFQANKDRFRELRRIYAQNHRGRLAVARKARVAKLREEAVLAYGGHCACCGLDDSRFLTFDHVNGDGREHRAQMGGGGSPNILYWLRSNGYPPSIQLLCWNCNCAKGIYGKCPHEEDKCIRLEA